MDGRFACVMPPPSPLGSLLTSLVTAALFLGCASSQHAPPSPAGDSSDPCHDADIAGKRVWNQEARVKVRAQVMEWGGEIGAEFAEQKALEITSSMDRVTDDWARMRKAVCKDHFTRQTLSKPEPGKIRTGVGARRTARSPTGAG